MFALHKFYLLTRGLSISRMVISHDIVSQTPCINNQQRAQSGQTRIHLLSIFKPDYTCNIYDVMVKAIAKGWTK